MLAGWLGWIMTIAACLASVARGGAYSWPIGRSEMVATQTGYIPPLGVSLDLTCRANCGAGSWPEYIPRISLDSFMPM